MNRDELEAEAKRLGVEYRSNIGDEALADRVAAAQQAEASAPEGLVAQVAVDVKASEVLNEVACKVLVANLWTSKGKFFLRDSVDLPRDEAQQLEVEDKVIIK